jgi:hypothetical protein
VQGVAGPHLVAAGRLEPAENRRAAIRTAGEIQPQKWRCGVRSRTCAGAWPVYEANRVSVTLAGEKSGQIADRAYAAQELIQLCKQPVSRTTVIAGSRIGGVPSRVMMMLLGDSGTWPAWVGCVRARVACFGEAWVVHGGGVAGGISKEVVVVLDHELLPFLGDGLFAGRCPFCEGFEVPLARCARCE